MQIYSSINKKRFSRRETILTTIFGIMIYFYGFASIHPPDNLLDVYMSLLSGFTALIGVLLIAYSFFSKKFTVVKNGGNLIN